MHTVQQVKVLLAAADALPATPTITYDDTAEGEAQYRRAIDVLDSLGMISGGHWHESELGPFESVNVVEAETGERLCSMYGPRGVRCLASVAPMRRLVALTLGDPDAA